jgi:hypothetical protein
MTMKSYQHSLDTLNARMTADAIKLHDQAGTTFNFGTAAQIIQQEPPPVPAMLFHDVLCNRYAAQVVKHALGPEPVIRCVILIHSAGMMCGWGLRGRALIPWLGRSESRLVRAKVLFRQHVVPWERGAAGPL